MEGAITVLCLSLLCLCSHASVHQGGSNASGDELALLSFKTMLSSPSQGLLASWNASNHFCRWPGVSCGRRHPERVVSLHVNSFNISGRISSSLGNLTFLGELDLGGNQLFGEVPVELCRLFRLQALNLSNNQLQGQIPPEIGLYLKDLVYLNLGFNLLSGEIPLSLSDLPSLEHLSLYYNRLSGAIPSGLGNVTSLRVLHLDFNMLSGSIPSSLGMLPRLSTLTLGANNLSGPIPNSVWNISTLTWYSVQQNMLNGSIPPSAFSNLPNLQAMFMDHNFFHGPIPRSIANASDLWIVQVGHNPFSGVVPPEIGKLSKLQRLVLLETLLEAKEPKDWEFFVALTNCSQLQFLELGISKFGGVLPNSVSNLSTSLIQLNINDNNISGSFPSDIGNLINLQYLDFSKNSFTGSLPSSLGTLKSMALFYVFDNYMSGSVPLTIGNLTELNYLRLNGNSFSGRIPSTLGNLRKLELLDLSSNKFVGTVPIELFNITTLSNGLDLSSNNLEGSIPQEIGKLKGLIVFSAGWNKLSGEIPITLGECQLLQSLDLQNNMLSGSIPALLDQLQGLETLDLSSNNLSGQIPKFLGNLTMLYYLNLSFNSFVGQVPSFGVFANASAISMQGNEKLCGGIPDIHLTPCSFQLPKKKHMLLMIPIVVTTTATLFILALLYFLHTKCKKGRTEVPSTMSMHMHAHPLVSYAQLVVATDGFSTINLLGSGSFGTVYKGNLHGESGESSNLVAVKVLKLQSPGSIKSFRAECEALRHLRHRNLVKIETACLSIDNNGNDFKAIVYEFMPNGSLECWLHPDTTSQTEQKSLNLLERMSILLDVAFALDYLHCHGPAPVIHCDLKPSNVLLDADMVAHVGDFGLAKIIVDTSPAFQQSMSSMGFRGTIGYAPPG
jgi:receptor kinase-like protein